MQWHFGPFRLDLANACLWHAEQRVILRPKTFAILVYLVTHAGRAYPGRPLPPAAGAAVPGRIQGAAAVRGRDNAGAHAAGACRGDGSTHGCASLCPGGGGSTLE